MRLQTLKPRVGTLGARQAKPWDHGKRESRHARGYGWAWEQLRERIMRRDCGLCQVCRTHGHTEMAQAVDHITPKSMGGSDDESNLQAICNACHQAKTQAESGHR